MNIDYDVNTDNYEYLQELVNSQQGYLGQTLETVNDYDYEYDEYLEVEEGLKTEELVTTC